MLALIAVASSSTTAAVAASTGACPKVQTVGSANFNLTEWVRKTWYIQEQQVVDYQPLSSLFCVAATYDLVATQRFKPVTSLQPDPSQSQGRTPALTGGCARAILRRHGGHRLQLCVHARLPQNTIITFSHDSLRPPNRQTPTRTR